jgi:ATP-binding cassette, subfamily B, bacterial
MLALSGPGIGRGFAGDSSAPGKRITPGTVRKILPYARPYRWKLTVLLLATIIDSVITVSSSVLFKVIIDNGIMKHDETVVVTVALILVGMALVDALMVFAQAWYSARIGQGVIYDLRTEVFAHVQRQPVAFFTRTQTGSLVSRLNTDVIQSQQAITTLLSTMVSSVLTFVLILLAMAILSWQVTIIALLMIPLFIIPARLVGRRLQRLTRQSMQLNAEMASMMNERFNVAGAMLVKLYGRPQEETGLFADRASRVRDVGVVTTVYSRALFILLTLLAALASALVYGLGGSLVIDGVFQVGTLVALASLLSRIYGPITQFSSLQVSVMTALVSFDRIFEVLNLRPLVAERPGAVAVTSPESPPGGNGTAPTIEFDQVSFRYPTASEVSLASLESIALPPMERSSSHDMLCGVSFHARPRQLTALVGPSGAGKTTITYLVARLYDPNAGAVRIGGHDLRDLSLASLHETVGVVTQDSHLFHDTIRGNLAYARPGASERDLIEACRAAQIWDLISSLPDGLDTLVGDRGYRLSGGEKQRIALARLLLKAPPVVVLDEATAHLDSESEAAIQRALATALAGRTSLVIAHRLSTVRAADQILVVDGGQIVERGTHEELLAVPGVYSGLYRTQFAPQAALRSKATLK